MFELDVIGAQGYRFPVWRHAGAQEWNYFQVDGQYVALPDEGVASSFLDEVCAGLIVHNVVYRRLDREPVSQGRG